MSRDDTKPRRSFLREIKDKREGTMNALLRACADSSDPRVRSLLDGVRMLDGVIDAYKESRHGDE